MSSQETISNGVDRNGSSSSPGKISEDGGQQGLETPQLSSTLQDILHQLRSADGKSIDLSFVEMDEHEAQMIGQAIAASQHLEELTIQLDSIVGDGEDEPRQWPYDTVLATAFLGPRPNTSVRSLIIAGSGTDGDLMRLVVLPRLIRENSTLTRLEFQWRGDDGTSREETRELFDSLLKNSTLRTLVLPSLDRWDFDDSQDGGFIDAETFSQVLKLVEENKSIDHLDLQIGECRGPGSQDLNLPAFYTALRSNSTIKTLRLRGNFVARGAESEILKWIETTDSLEELHLGPLYDYLEEEEEEGGPSFRFKHFFRSLRENRSLKKLVLEEFSFEDDEDLTELMDAIKVNSILREIIFDPEEEHGQAVREALQSRAAHDTEPDS